MPFLQRSRSLGPTYLFSSPSENALPATAAIPFPQAAENINVLSRPYIMSSFTKGRRNPAGTIIRRVSTMLKRRKRPAFAPLNMQAPPESQWKVINESSSLTDSDISFDDIRRPSGLGSAASISSDRSLPSSPFTAVDRESPFQFTTKDGHERSRAISSPHPQRSPEAPKTGAVQRSVSYIARRNRDCPPPPMPFEVLINILTFTPRHAVASHALTSRDWCSAARIVLYETVELWSLRPEQVDLLVTLLAYRHDLADLVRSFECHTWPDFFPPSPNIDGASFSPALTAVFTVAFQNMHLITSLVLPSFDRTFLRHHSAFGLKKLTILSRTMTSNETTRLFAWLNGQTNITHLSFPNLLDSNNTHSEFTTIPKNPLSLNSALTGYSNIYSASTPVLTSSESPSSPLPPVSPASPSNSPFNSLNLLPALTTLVATPFIITSLTTNRCNALSRPLQHVTLNINNTLYTGLRPSALLTPLHGINTLVLKFSNAVDRRTIAKVLGACAVLTTPPATTLSSSSSLYSSRSSSRSKALLQNLEFQLSDSAAGADRALYKAISASISRYQGLVRLNCCFAPDVSLELALKGSPLLIDHDNVDITTWTKHCPSLQAVTLLSGATFFSLSKGPL